MSQNTNFLTRKKHTLPCEQYLIPSSQVFHQFGVSTCF